MSHYVPSITDTRKSERWGGHQWHDFHTKCHKNLVPKLMGGEGGTDTRSTTLLREADQNNNLYTDEKPWFRFILIAIE
jgi:hypothetical protein